MLLAPPINEQTKLEFQARSSRWRQHYRPLLIPKNPLYYSQHQPKCSKRTASSIITARNKIPVAKWPKEEEWAIRKVVALAPATTEREVNVSTRYRLFRCLATARYRYAVVRDYYNGTMTSAKIRKRPRKVSDNCEPGFLFTVRSVCGEVQVLPSVRSARNYFIKPLWYRLF